MAVTAHAPATMKHRFGPELLIPIAAAALAFIFPNQLNFLMLIAITSIFVLSLDLVVGYCGVATLGHAAFFGTGAYAAGIYAINVTAEPLSGLIIGSASAALVAFLSGLVVLRAHGLTLLMMTVAVAQVLYEIANKARSVTGGDDGLYGITMSPILGVFEFDFYSRTGFAYSVIVLTLVMTGLRVLVTSPFGRSAVGIREDRERMSAMGMSVFPHLLKVYVISGSIAGLAGALMAQTVQVVGLNSLSFTMSAEALIMLVLGGLGRLWGALIGTLVFMMIHHTAAELDPFRWMFLIGAMLVGVVLFLPGGIFNALANLAERLRRSATR
ncbi:MAG: branched-chain amino acid ABC transporter permease [Rhizobiaceae bacterium]|nr:branched-chain amino acid ABC transporter permease [Rhizobiaceae bacterium]